MPKFLVGLQEILKTQKSSRIDFKAESPTIVFDRLREYLHVMGSNPSGVVCMAAHKKSLLLGEGTV